MQYSKCYLALLGAAIFFASFFDARAQMRAVYKPAIPLNVYVDTLKAANFPAVYLNDSNNFRFISSKKIQAVYVDSFAGDRPSRCMLVTKDNDIYKIMIDWIASRQPIKTQLKLPISLNIHFVFSDNTIKTFNAPLRLSPPVKILMADSMYRPLGLTDTNIRYCGKIQFGMVWDPPAYVSNWYAPRGHFRVNFLSMSDSAIAGIDGWNDLHDSSPFFDLSSIKKFGKVKLKTIDAESFWLKHILGKTDDGAVDVKVNDEQLERIVLILSD